jgi:hypothetical protein
MVRSLAVVLGVVAIVLLVTWRPQPDPISVVDVAPFAQLASAEASFIPLQVDPILDGYQPTSARWEPTTESGGEKVWFLGYVTPEGEYLQVSQSVTREPLFIAEQTAEGIPGELMEINDATWQRFETPDRRSLVQESESGVTIVSGTMGWDALATATTVLAPVD